MWTPSMQCFFRQQGSLCQYRSAKQLRYLSVCNRLNYWSILYLYSRLCFRTNVLQSCILVHAFIDNVEIAARVRKLIKSDPEVKKIASEAVKTLTHAIVRSLSSLTRCESVSDFGCIAQRMPKRCEGGDGSSSESWMRQFIIFCQ